MYVQFLFSIVKFVYIFISNHLARKSNEKCLCSKNNNKKNNNKKKHNFSAYSHLKTSIYRNT